MKVFTFILLSVASLAASERPDGHPLYSDTVKGHDKRVVCYWGTWANYRPVEGKFTPESVDGSLCTHLIYVEYASCESCSELICKEKI